MRSEYRMSNLVVHLVWVDLDLDVPQCCPLCWPFLPNSPQPRQNLAGSGTPKIKINPTQAHDHMRHPVQLTSRVKTQESKKMYNILVKWSLKPDGIISDRPCRIYNFGLTLFWPWYCLPTWPPAPPRGVGRSSGPGTRSSPLRIPRRGPGKFQNKD